MSKMLSPAKPRFARALAPCAVLALLALTACAGAARHSGDGVRSANVAAALDPQVLATVQAATFEVVVKKPAHDSLGYERPLPLDLLPYAVRQDAYESRGTAFAVAANRFVSAAHVFDIGNVGQRAETYLRDREGRVYPVDRVWKFSYRRDFIVFSIRNGAAARFFQPETGAHVNSRVYAVGNALGEGIVIRDGLYTSDTPEDRDGAWQWLRFSAAASPGNSGGPLLDEHGKVIGIVQRKSENENLNFALPIAEVLKAKDRKAEIDTRMAYSIDNMPLTKAGELREELRLPLPLAELSRRVAEVLEREGARLMRTMFREHREQIFPRGRGSEQLLHSNFSSLFPGVVAQASDGIWRVYTPERDKMVRADLGANGYLGYGTLGASVFFRLRAPDDVALADLARDSKRFMDLYMRAADYSRTIMSERVKITSLGPAKSEKVFTDSYRRKWLVRTWLIEFSDQALVMLALPVPDGMVGMYRIVPTGQTTNHLRDLQALADFAYVSYYGTLAQWRRFLAMKPLLPGAFDDIALDFTYGQSFRYRSSRVAFAYPSALMPITPDSDLQIGFSYFRDGKEVVWDVTRVVAGENKNTGTVFSLIRNLKPSATLDDDYKSNWRNLSTGKYPYDMVVASNDGRSVIGTRALHPANRSRPAAAPVLYAVWHVADGALEQKVGERKLAGFLKSLEVREHEAGRGARVAGK